MSQQGSPPPARAPPSSDGGEEAPAKTKGELRRERAATQEAQRAAKALLKAEAAERKRSGAAAPAAAPGGPAAAAKPQQGGKAKAAEKKQGDKKAGAAAPGVQADAGAEMQRKRARRMHELAALHPELLRLGQQMERHDVLGGNARAAALVQVLRAVIRDYERTPARHVSFARGDDAPSDSAADAAEAQEGRRLELSFAQQLRKQVDKAVTHLNSRRRISQSMGSVTSYLKLRLLRISDDTPDDEVRRKLDEELEQFVDHNIIAADKSIAHRCVEGADEAEVCGHRPDPKLKMGDVVLTFGRSNAVEWTFRLARARGLDFSVIVVDSRPLLEGRGLALALSGLGIRTAYCQLSSLSHVLRRCSKVFVGASTMLTNGSLVSRMGTAMVCTMAKHFGRPVLCFCETYKFSSKVWLGSFVNNEDGDSADLLTLPNGQPSPLVQPAEAESGGVPRCDVVMHKLYDVTPANCIDMVVTELGCHPPSCVPVLVRERLDRIDNPD